MKKTEKKHADPLRPVDAKYVTDLRTQLEKRYATARDRLTRIRELRNFQRATEIPDALKDFIGVEVADFRDPAIADELFELVSIFTEKDPNLVITSDGSKAGVANSTLREHFTTAALLRECGCRTTGASTFERLVDAVFEGGGWTCLQRTPDTWAKRYGVTRDDYDDDGPEVPAEKRKTAARKYDEATEEAKRVPGHSVPIVWRAVDALTVFPVYYGLELGEVLEVQKRSLNEAFRQYRLGLSKDKEVVPESSAVQGWSEGIDGSESVEFITHCDKHTWTYFISYAQGGTDGKGSAVQVGEPIKHDHGFVPYFFAPGFTQNADAGTIATWSFSEPKRHLVETNSFFVTLLKYLALRDALPPIAEERPADAEAATEPDTGNPAKPETYQMGTRYPLPPGGTLRPLIFQNTAQLLQAQQQQLEERIERMSVGRGAPGQSMGESGFHETVLITKDRQKVSQFRRNIARHLRDVTYAFWEMLKQLGEPVHVLRCDGQMKKGWVTLDPDDDLKHPVDVTWELVTDTTAAAIILERYLSAREQNGSLGMSQVVERLGDNWDEVRRERAKYRIMQLPQYLQAEEAEVWATWGRGEWSKMQEQADAMMAMLAPPQMDPMAMGGPVGVGGGGLPGQVLDPSLMMSPGGEGVNGPMMPMGAVPGMPASPQVPTAASAAALG